MGMPLFNIMQILQSRASDDPSPYIPSSLILNFGGVNGSTTFTDVSGNGVVVDGYGGEAEISSAITFDGANMLKPNNGMLHLSPTSVLDLTASSAATVEMYWYQPTPTDTVTFYLGSGTSGGDLNGWFLYSNFTAPSTFTFTVYRRETPVVENTAPIAINEWHHLAVVFQPTDPVDPAYRLVTLYVDGTAIGQDTCPISAITGTDRAMLAGSMYGPRMVDGFLGPVRIAPSAVYTANFTPAFKRFKTS